MYPTDLVEGIIRTIERKVDGEPNNLVNSKELLSINILAKTIIDISREELAIDRSKPTGTDKYVAEKTQMEAAPNWTPEVSMEAGVAEGYDWQAGELGRM